LATHILQTLRADHDILRSMQELLLQTSGNTGARQQLWYRLKRDLLAHAEAEERALYRHLMQIDTTEHVAAHSVEEHDAIEELIDQLDHMGFDQPQWLPTLERLVHMSNHHLDEEEAELFPVAGRVLSDDEKSEMSDAYRQHKVELLAAHEEQWKNTTREGVDERTLESRRLGQLRNLARERGFDAVTERSRSELISALRGAPGTDA